LGGVCLKKSEPILRKILTNETETMRTRQGKLFFWGFGFALPRLISRPQEGSGEECGRVSELFFQKRILNFVFQNASPRNYLKNKTPTIYEQKFITKDNANNFLDFSLKANTSSFHSIKTTIASKNKIISKLDLKKEK